MTDFGKGKSFQQCRPFRTVARTQSVSKGPLGYAVICTLANVTLASAMTSLGPTKLIGPKNKSTIGTTRTSVIFRLENWTKDGTKVDRLLYAGNYLDKARLLFEAAIKHRPRIRLTIRQRVLRPWRRFH